MNAPSRRLALLAASLPFAVPGALTCALLHAPAATTPAPPAPPAETDTLQAVAWVQTAAEHRIACGQTFRAATLAMHAALAAASPFDARPPAVIVDVDETVLDNSPYQARLLQDAAEFTPESWDAWVQQAAAPPVPGAVAFAAACRAAGVRVFYVTNRNEAQEAATRRNLETAGFAIQPPGEVDVVLTKGEFDKDSNKAQRRAHVDAGHRVLLLVGDDLNDFTTAAATRAERDAQVQQNLARIGATWFLVPNPMYGSWERAITGGATPTTAQKLSALEPMRQ